VPTLSLNGKTIEVPPEMAMLPSVLLMQGYQDKRIAVAINGKFVPRSQYDDTPINEGDEVDVIQAVGGG
jgi:sulfur carrier protein